MSATIPVDPSIDLCLAPLRGVTGCSFRAAYCRHFGGFSRAVSPFVSTVRANRVKPALLADLLPQRNCALPLVPQVIGKDPADLVVMLRALRDLGYTQADLNAGCPWPMVVRKGRGAGLLLDPDRLRRMLDAGCSVLPDGFSIKVRLGIASPDLLEQRMEAINDYPLREVTIHPRTARQMYEGRVNLGAFAACMRLCRRPVVYNGDIRTVSDAARLRAEFPAVTRWMIGRGAIADPFLPARIRGEAGPRDLSRLRAWLDELLDVSRAESCGDRPVLGRLKELWGMLAPSLSRDGRLLKRIHCCHRVDEYRRVVDECFDRSPVWFESADGLPETCSCA